MLDRAKAVVAPGHDDAGPMWLLSHMETHDESNSNSSCVTPLINLSVLKLLQCM